MRRWADMKPAERERRKRQAYLATLGWSPEQIAGLLIMPARQALDELETAMCTSAGLRRVLGDVLANFPEAKVTRL